MKAFAGLAVVAVAVLLYVAYVLEDPPPVKTHETCKIMVRQATTITTQCVDDQGRDTHHGRIVEIKFGAYPACIETMIWTDCQTK